MDAADLAQKEIDLRLAQNISKVKSDVIPTTGHCHFCNEVVSDSPFCDSDCRDDFEQERKMKTQRPKF